MYDFIKEVILDSDTIHHLLNNETFFMSYKQYVTAETKTLDTFEDVNHIKELKPDLMKEQWEKNWSNLSKKSKKKLNLELIKCLFETKYEPKDFWEDASNFASFLEIIRSFLDENEENHTLTEVVDHLYDLSNPFNIVLKNSSKANTSMTQYQYDILLHELIDKKSIEFHLEKIDSSYEHWARLNPKFFNIILNKHNNHVYQLLRSESQTAHNLSRAHISRIQKLTLQGIHPHKIVAMLQLLASVLPWDIIEEMYLGSKGILKHLAEAKAIGQISDSEQDTLLVSILTCLDEENVITATNASMVIDFLNVHTGNFIENTITTKKTARVYVKTLEKLDPTQRKEIIKTIAMNAIREAISSRQMQQCTTMEDWNNIPSQKNRFNCYVLTELAKNEVKLEPSFHLILEDERPSVSKINEGDVHLYCEKDDELWYVYKDKTSTVQTVKLSRQQFATSNLAYYDAIIETIKERTKIHKASQLPESLNTEHRASLIKTIKDSTIPIIEILRKKLGSTTVSDTNRNTIIQRIIDIESPENILQRLATLFKEDKAFYKQLQESNDEYVEQLITTVDDWETYNNQFILIHNNLFYVQYGIPKEVYIANMEQFKKSLEDDTKKGYPKSFTQNQIYHLITKNGGYSLPTKRLHTKLESAVSDQIFDQTGYVHEKKVQTLKDRTDSYERVFKFLLDRAVQYSIRRKLHRVPYAKAFFYELKKLKDPMIQGMLRYVNLLTIKPWPKPKKLINITTAEEKVLKELSESEEPVILKTFIQLNISPISNLEDIFLGLARLFKEEHKDLYTQLIEKSKHNPLLDKMLELLDQSKVKLTPFINETPIQMSALLKKFYDHNQSNTSAELGEKQSKMLKPF